MSRKCMHDFYTFGDMKSRMQNLIIENDYFWFLLAADEMMFEYENMPEEIDQFRMEDFLNLTGGIVWKKVGETHMIAPWPAREGQINMFGYGERAHSTTLNGISLEGTVGEDAAIIYNNTVRSPQNDLYTTADIFTDIDCSSKINVQFARVAPIYGVQNDKQKAALEELLKKVVDGEIKTIVSDADTNINEIMKPDSGIKTIDAITEPEKIQYIQYLSQYFDIRLRRHFARRGLSLKTSDKQAQVTRDEVHGMDAVTWFYPLSKLKARQIGLDMVNRIYGTKISVHFSELWQQEWEAYKLRSEAEDAQEEQEADNLRKEGEDDGSSADLENDQ